MRILSLVQAILAAGFILFALVVLFGIGITGLLFLAPAAVFAVTAEVTQENSRADTAVALAVDGVLAYLAARKLQSLFASGTSSTGLDQTAGALQSPGLFDYLPPAAALVLVAIGAFAVAMDWRALRKAPWF